MMFLYRNLALFLQSISNKHLNELVATDNGDPTSFTPFQSAERESFNGLALAIVRGKKGTTGKMQVKVSGAGLESASIEIEVK